MCQFSWYTEPQDINTMLHRLLLGLTALGMAIPLSADITVTLGGVPCADTHAGLCTAFAPATQSQISFDGYAGVMSALTFTTPNGKATYSWDYTAESPIVNDSVS